MSIIEKAMSKIGAPVPNTNFTKKVPRSQEFWRQPTAPVHQRDDFKEKLANVQPTLALDYLYLKTKGVIAPDDMGARVNDEFRRIKRPLLANIAGGANHTAKHNNLVMITSSLAGEGKTHIAINLALNLAREVDYTVLLVDADVIKRETSELLGITEKPGLIDLLHDDHLHVEDLLLRTDVSQLAVLPAGQLHEQTTELLSSREMTRLVDGLAGRYSNRIIIFDAPPLLSTAEAQVIAELMDQIVMVVEACRTSPSVIEEALAVLDSSKPIGLILNKSQRLLGADDYGDYYKRQV